METQTTNQQQWNHGRWPEANVGQQYRKGPDSLVYQMLTVPITINPEKSLLWDPDPGPSTPSRIYALQYTTWARDPNPGQSSPSETYT